MLTRAARVALNALSNYLHVSVSLAVMFCLTPVIIRSVGEADFGLWALTSAVVGVLELLDAGLLTGVVKWVAESRGNGDLDRRNRMLSTVQLAYLVLSLTALSAVAVLSLVYLRLFAIPAEHHSSALALLWILAARTGFVGLPLRLFMGTLFGDQRIVLINGVRIPSTLLYGVVGWTAMQRGGGIVTLAWLTLGVSILEQLAYVVLAFKCVPGLRLSWRLVDRSLLKEVFSVSSAQVLTNVSSLIVLRTDLILVKFFLPMSAVAVYAIALKIAELAYLMIKQFVNALSPLIAELKGEGRDDEMRFLLLSPAKFVSAAAVMMTATIYVFAQDAITFWIGPQLAAAAPVLLVLITAMAVTAPSMVAADVLFYTGHHRVTARAALLGIVVNLACSVALVGPLDLLGIASGTLCAALAVELGVVTRRACQVYGVSYAEYARRVLVPAALPGVAQAGLIYGLKTVLPPSGLGAVGLEALAGVVLYGVIFWGCCVEQAERKLCPVHLLRFGSGSAREPSPSKASS